MTPTGRAGQVDLPPVGPAALVGDVIEFDEPRGVGTLEYGAGRRLGFHCTAITDGSRRIAIGTVVAFTVRAGHLGHLEAASVRPLPGVVPPGSTLEVPVQSSAGSSEPGSSPSEPVGGTVSGGPEEPGAESIPEPTPPSGIAG